MPRLAFITRLACVSCKRAERISFDPRALNIWCHRMCSGFALDMGSQDAKLELPTAEQIYNFERLDLRYYIL